MASTTPASINGKGPGKAERGGGGSALRRRIRHKSPPASMPMPSQKTTSPSSTRATPVRVCAYAIIESGARSSRAEQTTHNRWVDGSNPSGPTRLDKIKNLCNQVPAGGLGGPFGRGHCNLSPSTCLVQARQANIAPTIGKCSRAASGDLFLHRRHLRGFLQLMPPGGREH